MQVYEWNSNILHTVRCLKWPSFTQSVISGAGIISWWDHEAAFSWQNLALRWSKVYILCIYGHVASGFYWNDAKSTDCNNVHASFTNMTAFYPKPNFSIWILLTYQIRYQNWYPTFWNLKSRFWLYIKGFLSKNYYLIGISDSVMPEGEKHWGCQ